MSLSRVLVPGKYGPKIFVVTSKRTDIHIPKYYDAEAHERIAKYQESYMGGSFKGEGEGISHNVGFIGRIIARFKGQALPGEKEAPEAFFQHTGLDYVPDYKMPQVPADYKEHPERDLKNFPYPQRHLYPLKTRLIVIPDSWFQAFHSVSGSSGPYAFIFSVGSFLVNKEYLIWDENIAIFVYGWLFWYCVLRNAFQAKLDKWACDKLINSHIVKHKKVISDDLETVNNFKKIQSARKDALVTAKENFPAILKENMELQLEVTYRKNIEKLASELKRRLDYLKETESVKMRLERSVYLSQIIDNVRKQIENNENGIKDVYLDYCIDQLKDLATKQK